MMIFPAASVKASSRPLFKPLFKSLFKPDFYPALEKRIFFLVNDIRNVEHNFFEDLLKVVQVGQEV